MSITTMDNLYTVYKRLEANPNDTLSNIKLYRSEIHYAKAAIQAATGIDLTLKEVDKYLEEEGMQPAQPEEGYTVEQIYYEVMKIINKEIQPCTAA
tara:strand:+ start:600 stop:887 length:288 start_codon:yes stop_codon:yes gene_type:complete